MTHVWHFFTYLSQNPLVGEVIKGTGGLRKIRWATSHRGKSGGVRVIYYNLLDDGVIICLAIYAKNQRETLSKNTLNKLGATQ